MVLRYWRCGLAVAILSVLLGVTARADDVVKVGIYYPQVPPYMYKPGDGGAVQGLIPDLLNRFFRQTAFTVRYIEENRQRAELKLYAGDIDIMVLSEKWSQQPDQLLYSLPVLTHRDYLYSLTADKLKPLALLQDSTVCLRRHYVYTGLQQALESGRLLRQNANSEFDQLNMLVNGRCDFAYLNEHVAQWLTTNYFSAVDLYRSDYTVDETGMTLALHKKWQALLPQLNAFLLQASETGVTATLLQQHIGTKSSVHSASD